MVRFWFCSENLLLRNSTYCNILLSMFDSYTFLFKWTAKHYLILECLSLRSLRSESTFTCKIFYRPVFLLVICGSFWSLATWPISPMDLKIFLCFLNNFTKHRVLNPIYFFLHFFFCFSFKFCLFIFFGFLFRQRCFWLFVHLPIKYFCSRRLCNFNLLLFPPFLKTWARIHHQRIQLRICSCIRSKSRLHLWRFLLSYGFLSHFFLKLFHSLSVKGCFISDETLIGLDIVLINPTIPTLYLIDLRSVFDLILVFSLNLKESLDFNIFWILMQEVSHFSIYFWLNFFILLVKVMFFLIS